MTPPGGASLPITVGAEKREPGFTLDLGRCVGCGACVLACRIENQLPTAVSWRRIVPVNLPRYGGGPTYHLSVSCHHCSNPPCVGACPSGALGKGSDGLVLIEAALCIGCRYCEMACPFGAPSFDAEARVMTKCHLCHPRLSEGLAPACVAACPTEALGFVPPGEEGGAGAATKVLAEKDPASRAKDGAPPAPDPLVPATEVPGFDDPAGASPCFRLAVPRGELRAEGYERLKAALARTEGDP